MSISTFTAAVPDDQLGDLRHRLQRARWPDSVDEAGWSKGTPPEFLRRIVEHWRDRFDWRAAEARLNAFPQIMAEVDGTRLHVVHLPSTNPDAVPLLMTNGWPSSIFEYLDVLPRLADAGFHVVAPALPGYGFSERPSRPGTTSRRIAELFAGLMTELGYPRFIAHGSDMGAGVVEQLRSNRSERLIGVHFCNVYWGYPKPDDPTPEEAAYLGQVQGWTFAEGAYAMVQATKPQTLSYGLNDSPIGLAAWILEKFHAWSDGDPDEVYGLDGLCANLTLYWVTQTMGSSVRLYAEAAGDPADQRPPERGTVPVGVIVFPKDILPAPRAWGERWLNLVHWTEASRGGHFGAWEAPDLFAADLAAFAEALRRT